MPIQPLDDRQILMRRYSTIAKSFSAALDDMFKLNGIDALELSVEQKYGPSTYSTPSPQTLVMKHVI